MFSKIDNVYIDILKACFSKLGDILSSADFMFFSIVCLGIGTMGVWIPVVFQLDINASSSEKFVQAGFDNIAIFMYVASVLGTVAAEYLIKNETLRNEKDRAIRSFLMFVWFLAMLLSFWAFKEPRGTSWQLWISLWLTISLWLCFTRSKKEFNYDQGEVTKELSGGQVGSAIQGKGF